MKRVNLLSNLFLGCIALFTVSCSDDDSNDIVNPTVEAPDTYSFDRNGNSTVSYDGQTTRILMADEFKTSLLDNSKTEADLLSMYAHQEGEANFSQEDLNASGKNLRSKTAASRDYYSANTTEANQIKNQVEGWISAQVDEVYANWTTPAEQGIAGQIQEAGGGSIRYVNDKGLEYDQAIILTLLGGVMTDQMLNNYLSTSVLDEAGNLEDNTNGITEDGANYTTMEHKWDEAFGYLYGTDNKENPQLGQDQYLNKYLGRAEGDVDFAGIADEVYNAFILGRAAIVAGDYDLRNAQAEIIREEISKVIGIRAVYYLQQAKSGLENNKGAAFHDLSEGYGFINSLQFTRMPNTEAPYFSKAEVDTMLNTLMEGDGFWEVSETTLDELSNQIADRFSFTVEQAGS